MFTKLRASAPINNLDRDPFIYREAILRPDAVKWSEAMQKELNFLLKNNTWILQQALVESVEWYDHHREVCRYVCRCM